MRFCKMRRIKNKKKEKRHQLTHIRSKRTPRRVLHKEKEKKFHTGREKHMHAGRLHKSSLPPFCFPPTAKIPTCRRDVCVCFSLPVIEYI